MIGTRRAARRLAVAALLASFGLVPAAALASTRAPHNGWTITIASPTSSTPTWAYPYAAGGELTTGNVEAFQQLLYRPLYFFGASSSVRPSAAFSLATPPVYSAGNTVVSFTMKPGLRWSDGQLVGVDGVVEWLNLLAAFPGAWGDYLSPLAGGTPLGIPDDVRAVAVSGATVTLTLSGPVNPTWFTDNELSQITPLPASWDLYEPSRPHVPTSGPLSIAGNHGHFNAATAAAGCYGTHWIGDGNHGPAGTFVDPFGTRTVVGSGDVAQAQRCVDVVELFRSMATDRADYTAPGTDVAAAFGISDGPWRLVAYHGATGAVTMVPNRAAGASGAHAVATRLVFVPCAGAAACVALLEHGRVDQGTLPTVDAPAVSSLAAAPSRNPLRTVGYRETVVAPWSTSYAPYNFASTLGADGHAGKVFAQRYVRIALQSLVDQPTVVARDLLGYGVPTDAPVPSVPSTGFASTVINPAPFSVARAAAILAHHGWHVAPGRTTVCAVPAQCGSGIPRGTPLAFSLVYASSSTSAASMTRLARDAARAGVTLTLRAVPAAQVLADVSGGSRTWDLASWGGGWAYTPDYFPSGEWTFAAGSPWNVGGFDDARATSLVVATTRTTAALPTYDQYLASELPVLWQATSVTLLETRAAIRGMAVSPVGALTPETWRP